MGTAVALQTTRVWVLYGGDGVVSMGTGCLSARVGVRRGVAGSLSNGVGEQYGRISIMCGGASLWASTTMILSASTGSMIVSEDHVLLPKILPSPPPIEMAHKQEK